MEGPWEHVQAQLVQNKEILGLDGRCLCSMSQAKIRRGVGLYKGFFYPPLYIPTASARLCLSVQQVQGRCLGTRPESLSQGRLERAQ